VAAGVRQRTYRGSEQALCIPAVPDLAIVPRFLIKSSLVIPIPRSRMYSTLLSLSMDSLISRSAVSPSPNKPLSVRDKNLILSSASEALEMSSRRKTSLLLYSELMMMSISRVTSAWNAKCWAPDLAFLCFELTASLSLHAAIGHRCEEARPGHQGCYLPAVSVSVPTLVAVSPSSTTGVALRSSVSACASAPATDAARFTKGESRHPQRGNRRRTE
jgi:hypothetical protein